MSKLLTKIEAACLLGIGVELLEYFTQRCPKTKQKRKLQIAQDSSKNEVLFKTDEVLNFSQYLNEPWPKPPSGKRPKIPPAIKDDIAKESHLCCAICGIMINGEVAHIEPVSRTLNNSPENLIYLCSNHHTQYDYGFKPNNNVTLDEVKAAKLIKQNSRRRIMRYEENAVRVLKTVLGVAKRLEKDLKEEENAVIRQAQVSELKTLITNVPDYLKRAEEQANSDEATDELRDAILAQSEHFMKSTLGISQESNERAVRNSASQLVNLATDIELDLDEFECPHCAGTGTTGLSSNYCSLCSGDTVVSEKISESFNLDTYREVVCPRCHGRGMTGLVGDYCGFCKGDCLVDRIEAEEYDPLKLNEIECPHCHGSGTTGFVGDRCEFCGGSCWVSLEEEREYNPNSVDQVECPHCQGRGMKGNSNYYCEYCHGSCVVPKEELQNYDSNKIDEFECPHCEGSGMKGGSNYYCSYCLGACVVTFQEREEFNQNELDEVECPHCFGQGWIGNYHCSTCNCAAVISNEEAEEYLRCRNELVECPHCDGSGVKGLHGDNCNLCYGEKFVSKEICEQYYNKYG